MDMYMYITQLYIESIQQINKASRSVEFSIYIFIICTYYIVYFFCMCVYVYM